MHSSRVAFLYCQQRVLYEYQTCLYLQAPGEENVLVAGDPERQHMELCERRGGIPYHPNQIDFMVRTNLLLRYTCK